MLSAIESIERDAVIAIEAALPLPLHRALIAGEQRSYRVHHQGQDPGRIAGSIAGGVEPCECLDRFFKGAVAALGIGVASAKVRQRAHHLNLAFSKKLRQIRVTLKQEHGQVAAIDDVLASGRTLIDQIAEVRIELGGAAGEINGVGIAPVEGGEAGVHGFTIHDLPPAVRTGVDVAVAAGHVAELAEIDLEDLDAARSEGVGPAGPQCGREVSAGREVTERNPFEGFDLTSRFGQRGTARPQRRGRPWSGILSLDLIANQCHGVGYRSLRAAPSDSLYAYIEALVTCSSICRPWTSEAPPRMAVATCTASVISSRSEPCLRHSEE